MSDRFGVAGQRMVINAIVAGIVKGVPPYPFVREWAEHGLARHTVFIADQEMGAKADHLRFARSGGDAGNRVLMIGDAPGHLSAARANGVRFYPVSPGDDANSWKRLFEETLEQFFVAEYGGTYETARIAEFE